MAEFKLEIVSPERLVLSETATSATVPGADGYFTVVGEHAPLMSVLKPGFVTVVSASGATQAFYVRGGFADVSAEGLTILAEDARPAADFDRAEIEGFIVQAQREVDAAEGLEAREAAMARLDAWRNLMIDAASVATGTVH
jgi:F-type H+-transporting ATPase subunit epsilon